MLRLLNERNRPLRTNLSDRRIRAQFTQLLYRLRNRVHSVLQLLCVLFVIRVVSFDQVVAADSFDELLVQLGLDEFCDDVEVNVDEEVNLIRVFFGVPESGCFGKEVLFDETAVPFRNF